MQKIVIFISLFFHSFISFCFYFMFSLSRSLKKWSLNPKQTIRVKFTDVVYRTVETCREFHSKIQHISDDEMQWLTPTGDTWYSPDMLYMAYAGYFPAVLQIWKQISTPLMLSLSTICQRVLGTEGLRLHPQQTAFKMLGPKHWNSGVQISVFKIVQNMPGSWFLTRVNECFWTTLEKTNYKWRILEICVENM